MHKKQKQQELSADFAKFSPIGATSVKNCPRIKDIDPIMPKFEVLSCNISDASWIFHNDLCSSCAVNK